MKTSSQYYSINSKSRSCEAMRTARKTLKRCSSTSFLGTFNRAKICSLMNLVLMAIVCAPLISHGKLIATVLRL